MPLESLNEEQINIHDLTLEQEKKPKNEVFESYQELKSSVFHNEKNGFWNNSIDKEGKVDTQISSSTELLGVLVESIFDKDNAKKQYEKLKETKLYEPKTNYWVAFASEDGSIDLRDRSSDDGSILNRSIDNQSILLSFLCEAIWNKKKAAESYNTLKQTEFYNEDFGIWNMNGDIQRNIYCQLVSMLCEQKFNPSKAEEEYEKFKMLKTDDDEAFEDRSGMKPLAKYAFFELFNVLAQSFFDKNSASESYHKLKSSPLYDPAEKRWNHVDANGERNLNVDFDAKYYHSFDQLLGILCDNEFEDQKIDLDAPPLPETRKY